MEKFATFEKEIKNDGSFQQQPNEFTTPFGDQPNQIKPEKGRYHLVWMPACPHAHKVVIVRKLLGLESVITLGQTGPYRTKRGWQFSNNQEGKDPLTGVQFVQDFYLKANPAYNKRPTVPVIVDLTSGKVVNNDHFHLTLQLETSWQRFHKAGAPDLYPEALRESIDKWNKIIFEELNTGVYKVGFAHTQQAYEVAYDRLFDRLDQLEEHLSQTRYLLGDQITDADVRLYPTLARFDIVYYQLFKANKKRIKEYPNLWGYARDLYQQEAFGTTTDFEFIKDSYYRSPHLKKLFGNRFSILPKGPDLGEWTLPHNRENLVKR